MVRVNTSATEQMPEFVHDTHLTKEFFHMDQCNDTEVSVYSVDNDSVSERDSVSEDESSPSDDVHSQQAFSEAGCAFELDTDGSESDDEAMHEELAETVFERNRSSMMEAPTPLDEFTPSRFNTEQVLDMDNQQWAAQRYRETAVSLMASFGMELSPINDELVDREEEDLHMERLYVATAWDLVETFGKVHASTVVCRSDLVEFDPMEE